MKAFRSLRSLAGFLFFYSLKRGAWLAKKQKARPAVAGKAFICCRGERITFGDPFWGWIQQMKAFVRCAHLRAFCFFYSLKRGAWLAKKQKARPAVAGKAFICCRGER